MDRNIFALQQSTADEVALLAEGVDRNECIGLCYDLLADVALLAEGVDRNSIGL